MKYHYTRGGKSEDERKKLEAELSKARAALPESPLLGDDGLLGQWDRVNPGAGNEKFNPTGDLTITARIKTRQKVASVLSKYDWRGKQRSYVFGIGGEGEKEATPGHLFFWASSQTDPFDGVSLYGSQPVNDGEEHRVSVVFEAGKSVRLFVDGVEDKSARVIGKVPETIAISNRPLAIGVGYRNDAGAKAYRFEGDLKDLRLYGRALGKELGSGKSGERVAELMAALGGGKSEGKEVSVPVMRELSKPRDTFIHLRGSFLSRGDQVGPAVLGILANEGEDQPKNRLEFARWLVNGKNPLVARVVVNRFWQSYFGHGLVRTSDDFGSQGTPPTHSGLLDWLASEFVESGWDMKHINRLIVTSATYRQVAKMSSQLSERDPKNRLLSRMPRVRLPA